VLAVVVTRAQEVVASVLLLVGARRAWPSHGEDKFLSVEYTCFAE
jgi:hypothetical protein